MKTARVIFYLRLDKLNRKGEAPIYCRITVDRRRSQFSINRTVVPERWEEMDQLREARKPADRELNFYMESIRSRIKEIEREFFDHKTPLTAENIKNAISGKTATANKSRSLIEVYDLYIEWYHDLVTSDQAAAGTLDRYKQGLKHLEGFLKAKYNRKDIFIDELEEDFVSDFDLYLRRERKNEKGRIRKCANNSAVKYISNFRRVIKWAVKKKWLKYDLFASYEGKVRTIQRQYLTPEEIEIIENKEITIPRLNIIRDIFLFAVYTGYAYMDVKLLTHANIQRHIDGKLWVFACRQKTRVKENVMLLDPALRLIEKYKSHPECRSTGSLFPVPSNQKTNAYLKEIADICGINKTLTFHIGRHTFATSIMLANDASMETTSSAIGHSSLKQTQHYGKMVDSRLSREMKKVNDRLKRKKGGDDETETPAAV